MIWDYLRRFMWWRNTPQNLQPSENPNLRNFLCRWECCVTQLQKIVIWENLVLSLASIAAVNLLFWSLVYLECRFYGLIFFSLLVLVVCEVVSRFYGPLTDSNLISRAESVGSENEHIRVLTTSEMEHYIVRISTTSRTMCSRLRQLRESQPGTFCLLVCSCFIGISIVGRSISGVMLLYLLLMAFMTLPALYVRYCPCSLLPKNVESSQKENDSDVEEYLPDPTVGAMKILNLAGEPPSNVDDLLLDQYSARSTDSTSSKQNSLLPEASVMPSHDHSLSYLEPDMELPSPRQIDLNSDDSDLSENNDIHFQNKHFNGSSSGSEDEELEFAKGLKFSEVSSDVPDQRLGRLTNLGANILTGMARAVAAPSAPPLPEREASSDSDSFELISKDDL